jgi:hypothetical protein
MKVKFQVEVIKMKNKIKNCEKSRLNALCIQEKFAYDMFKSAKSGKEKKFYNHELERIRLEMGNIEYKERDLEEMLEY